MLVSTDVVGVLGSLDALMAIWPPEHFPNLEVIAWRWNMPSFIDRAQQRGYSIQHLHGRTGENSILIHAIDAAITPTDTLLTTYASTHNILLHDAAAPVGRIAPYIPPTAKELLIETTLPGSQGIRHAQHIVETLRSHYVPARLIIDIAHFFGSDVLSSGRVDHVWSDLVHTLQAHNATIPYNSMRPGIHLSIGTRTVDSLPLSNISDTMLSEIADIFRRLAIDRIVLEHQHANPLFNIGALSSHDRVTVRSHAHAIVSRLVKTGILSERPH